MIDWLKIDPKYLVGILLGILASFTGYLVLAWAGIAPRMRDVDDVRNRVQTIEIILKYAGADSTAAIALFP